MVQFNRLFVISFVIAIFALAGCAGKSGKTCCQKPNEPLSGTKKETAKTESPTPSAAAVKQADSDADWEPLFDGRSLYGWQIIDYAGKGEVTVKDGQIILGMGYMTGIKWTNDPPKMNYEVEYEAMRVEGSDFFASLTFLVNTNPCTFILGGWGGGTVGISSLNDMDASENETSKFMNFENGKWYKIRIRVTEKKIEAWINGEKLIDVVHSDKKVSLRPGDIELSAPFGFSTWSTTGALRNIRIRYLK
ncbi:MAG: 3-keto-disaccharide hydrolase [Verrucomicrobiia bacterium]